MAVNILENKKGKIRIMDKILSTYNHGICLFSVNVMRYFLKREKIRSKRVLDFFQKEDNPNEYLKSFVEGDDNPKIVDTMNGDTKGVLDSEGKANAYAFDNMSRKQRMDFIKRTKENKESFNKSNKNIKKSLDEKSDILASDLYKAGLSKHSKTLEKTLDSIEKEKKYFNY